MTIDPQNNYFVADAGNNAVKEVLASSGYTISRVVGSGFNAPRGGRFRRLRKHLRRKT